MYNGLYRLRLTIRHSVQGRPNPCSKLRRGSTTTSRLSSVMFSTGCQSHSASSTSSVYSLVYKSLHVAAPGYLRDCCFVTHSSASGLRLRSLERTDLRMRSRPYEDSLRRSCFLGPQSSMLEQTPASHSFG